MRAATQPHLSVRASTAPSVHGALLRALVALCATLALLVVWPLAVVHAQTAAAVQRTVASGDGASIHIVVAGETLWALAERYYGDGREWPKLASRNDVEGVAKKPLPGGRKLLIPARTRDAEVHAGATSEAVRGAHPTATPAPTPVVNLAHRDAAQAKTAVADAKATRGKKPQSATAAPSLNVSPAPVVAPISASNADGRSLAAQTSGKGDAAPPVRAAHEPRSVIAPRVVARAMPRSASSLSTARTNAYTSPASELADDSRMSPPQAGHLGIGASSPADPDVSRPARRIGLVSQADLAAARGKNEVATVFIRYVPDQSEVDASARAISTRQKPAWRRGEYEAAPFAVTLNSVLQAGRIVHRVGAPQGGTLGGAARVLLTDEVEIIAPAGRTLAVGDRLISANADRLLGKDSRIAIPSGVLVVTRVDSGKPILALVQRQSDVIEQGQPLFVDASAFPSVHAVAEPTVGSDVETRVLWAGEVTSIPSLQSFVLLSAGSAQGVKAGDQFALVKRTGIGAAAREERVAVARVVRSGPHGSSAMIVRQSSADIAIGEPAFRVARVP